MHEQAVEDARISLTEVAKVAPGRPSANCVWRWCRRGVLARSGARIRLEHVRIGGKIFTTRRWLDDFGRRLAAEDAKYFSLCEATSAVARSSEPPSSDWTSARHNRLNDRRLAEIEAAERELDARGAR
ncbi:MAG: hypothetical protein IPM18_00090 [Phycisphaerales bacterium]|nr:hypothetical protein [Phycisphaerales bacterium]